MRSVGLVVFAAAIGAASVYGFSQPGGLVLPAAISNCAIKGNVSIETGERIYHVPGQHYYNCTIISPAYGERWFCTEVEARAAGWRKAGY